jgi:phosphoadenosine phosphosulfate reductase
MPDFAESSSAAGTPALEIAALNAKYSLLSFAQRIEQLYHDFDPGTVMVTSSFAATSAYFLHIISRIRPQQTIFFIDTGYHFPETLSYKDYLSELYRLVVKDVRPEEWKHEFTARDETYKSDPDFCCSVNKVEPLDEVKKDYRVWVSSLMRWQTSHRAGLEIFEERGGVIKFYPMVDVGKDERDAYIREHQLPFHPLVARGYSSVGCSHCTVPGDDRAGRWVDTPKKECGLHL